MELEELARLTDEFDAVRRRRLAADKAAKALKQEETLLECEIINVLRANGVRSVGGTQARVTMQTKEKPVVEDWEALYGFIRENDAFELLHRRVTEAAVVEREWNVPGVGKFEVDKLTVSKI